MKKYRLTILWGLLYFSVLTILAFEKDDISYNVIEGTNTVKVVSSYSNTYPSEVHIPSKISHAGRTFTVTAIDSRAFFYAKGLQTLYIPNTITDLGKIGTFQESSITEVIFEDGCSITTIPVSCFERSKLKEIKIPSSVEIIEGSAFCCCNSLRKVSIPSTVKVLKQCPFGYIDYPFTLVLEYGASPLILAGKRGVNTEDIDLIINRPFVLKTLESRSIPIESNFNHVRNVVFNPGSNPNDYIATGYEEIIKINDRINPNYIKCENYKNVKKHDCILYVPKGMLDKYETSPFGSMFHNIQEF